MTRAATWSRLLEKRIRHFLLEKELVNDKQAIVIAVSGGSDSVALLHILSALYSENKRIAVYVDHGLRPHETPAEQKLVEALANECSATFVAFSVDVTKEQKERKCSPEEAARNLRYQALENIREQYHAQCIAVGHTSDDQAEEVLLRLIRGSGSAGLSGMAVKNEFIIRPLLNESKEALRDYLKKQKLSYCEDSSNSDLRFLRNKIRRDLLPNLEQNYNPSMRETLIQTASILAEENRLLDSLSEKVFQQSCISDKEQLTLHLSTISSEDIAIKRRLFEKICWQMSAKPSFKQISNLLNLVNLQNGSESHLANGLRAIKQEQNILFHYPSNEPGYRGSAVPLKSFATITIPTPGTYVIPELGFELHIRQTDFHESMLLQTNTQILDDASVSFPLTLRHHLDGETFHPLGSPGSKKISRFLTDQKIAITEKKNYPVLLANKTIVAVVGLRIDHSCRIRSNSSTCLQLQWKKV